MLELTVGLRFLEVAAESIEALSLVVIATCVFWEAYHKAHKGRRK